MSIVRWVAGGFSTNPLSTIQWSTDGYNWQNADIGGFRVDDENPDGGGYGIAYNGTDRWVAVGDGVNPLNSILWSPNGKEWYDASSGGFENGNGFGRVAYGDGWVAVGRSSGINSIQWSPDGRRWQDASSGGFSGGDGLYHGVAYDNDNGLWVASGEGSSPQNSIQWSTDGRTWQDASSGGFFQNLGDFDIFRGQGVAYGDNKWVVVGYGNTPETTILWSDNGKIWNNALRGGFGDGGEGSNYNGNGVAYNGTDRWVAVGKGSSPTNSILWSPDGKEWNDASNGFFDSDENAIGTDVTYDGNRWFAVGYGLSTISTILWSDDGRTWYDASSGGFLNTDFDQYRGFSIASIPVTTTTTLPHPVTTTTTHSPPLPCFLTGTHILTPTGYKKVEEIESGEQVMTSNRRAVPAKIYRFRIETATEETAPYCIQSGALGPNLPNRDLHISGNHAIQDIKGLWQIPRVLAKTNSQIQQYNLGKQVVYYHVECPNYRTDNLIAEGVTAESFNHHRQPTMWNKKDVGYIRKESGYVRTVSTHKVDRNAWWQAPTCSHAPARTQPVGPAKRSTDRRDPPLRPAAN